MGKYLLIALIFTCSFSGNAQVFSGESILNNENFDKQRWSWGYFLGGNTYDLNFNYMEEIDHPPYEKDFSVERSFGFNVGLIGNLRLNEYFDLRLEPGVSFNTINLDFNIEEEALISSTNLREVNFTFVHVPLLLKVSTKRLKNFKPFVVGGISTSINLSSNQDHPDDNLSGQFRTTTNSYYYEIGFGIDLYMYYFKFTPSIRGVFGLSDDLVRDNEPESVFTSNVDKMTTRGVFLNFTFQ